MHMYAHWCVCYIYRKTYTNTYHKIHLIEHLQMKSLGVSMRRAVVTSQVLNVAACNFTTKLEMMALGNLVSYNHL
jgi:hypothetical protein